jgi:dTMP kinase
MTASGRLITIEGLDGSGKSTLAEALAAALGQRGVPVALLREPGGAEVSERIRELLADPALQITPRAEALLYAAARAQLVEQQLEPLLAAGRWVLLDRFADSSLAYQGAGRQLGVEQVRAVNAFATGGRAPDRTLLLELEPALGRARARGRAGVADRLERERDEFFARVASGYRALAEADPGRIVRLDARRAPAELLADALAALADLLPAGA